MSEMADEMPADEMEAMPQIGRPRRRGGFGKTLTIIVVVVVIIAAVCCGIFTTGCFGLSMGSGIATVSNDWQAVFLSNGQVYFGKVQAVSKGALTLGNIYYLQVVSKPLQTTQQGDTAANQQAQQELTLIKLGNELHGPVDQMTINRDHVLLTEKLKKDSRVVQAINSYLKDQASKK